MSTEKKNLRSKDWFGKSDKMGFVHRSWLRNQGYPDDYFQANPSSAFAIPGGSYALQRTFPRFCRNSQTWSSRGWWISHGISGYILGETLMRPTTMLFRNLASMDTEETIRANPIDGVVLLTGCDKTTPSTLMGACSVDLPTIVVPAVRC